jgi:hypothetical protein
MNVEDIILAIRRGQVRITDHADEEAADDCLTFDEIYCSVMQGEIIEDYPTDRPFPSCLIMGKSFAGQAIHSVWAYNRKTQWAVLITVYRPDPARWIDWKVRVTK